MAMLRPTQCGERAEGGGVAGITGIGGGFVSGAMVVGRWGNPWWRNGLTLKIKERLNEWVVEPRREKERERSECWSDREKHGESVCELYNICI